MSSQAVNHQQLSDKSEGKKMALSLKSDYQLKSESDT
jgi:hypothetical protein